MSRVALLAALDELTAITREAARAREQAECDNPARPICLGFRAETARSAQESPTIRVVSGLQ